MRLSSRAMSTSVVVGGSSGIGRFLAERFAGRGDDVVVSSRSAATAEDVARAIGGSARGIALDLSQPSGLEAALKGVDEVDNLVVTAIEQGAHSLQDFDIESATRAVTIKLVGYTELVRVLRPRLRPAGSVVLFGGMAKDRPYPGSIIVTAFNRGVSGVVHALVTELAPHRINAVHPGVVGDSPKWRDVADHPHLARTPIGRLVTMDEVADAVDFLLRNSGVNGQDLMVDGGLLAT